ncbi:YacP-like NYN domain-containing protein [Nocardioides alpinus]|uniref:RNA-binding protein n=1 Tax=Nocardioides alpinus TaxID=748909 RepID=A0A1I0X5R8_9ACTN|nr:NYN domain-containing protein [Nocardioides alpinus]PKH44111.1 RNA-binding protein [Nocardioides alpinus]SFA95720.1 YacP-like NYN domain-containing protein [Nocardioides alpinus]
MTESAVLPERLRLRVVALVSAVLPTITPVPARLRKVADFAPARRARLGGGLIWEALAEDEFRGHAAVQVAALPAGEDDPVDAAARAWLVRDEGWESVVSTATESLDDSVTRDDVVQAEIGRLAAQVASLQAEVASLRAEHKDELDRARSDYKVLRQRLGEARGVLRGAEDQRDTALAARDEALAAAETATRAADADVRRLRAQLEEAETALAATRRDSRSERDAGTIRVRLLLDAVVESATGLRRELGLPAVTGVPGGAVEAELAGVDAAPASSAPASPALLEQTLALPRARLIVDGYNVTKQAWPSASLEAQRSRLVAALGPLVARSGAETTVVFDAAESTTRTAMPAPRGVRVVFSPEGVIADDVIRQLVAAEPRGRVVVVVSGDQAVVRDVVRSGARAVPPSTLTAIISA